MAVVSRGPDGLAHEPPAGGGAAANAEPRYGPSRLYTWRLRFVHWLSALARRTDTGRVHLG